MIKNEKNISIAVIKRLPKYYRYLGYLLDKDIKKTSSKELANIMGITASQVRQDLNNFGCFGQQGYGYDVVSLYIEIKKILGIDSIQNMIIIGFGNMGKALASYSNFEKRGFNIIGIFEKNPNFFNIKIRNIQIFDIKYLEDFCTQNKIDIAILTVPNGSAELVAKMLVKCNVKGIWNFSNMELNIKDSNIFVENIQLTDSLMTLSYKLNQNFVK
ncbi:MAG: redox-sensing transcriptional repressor Rex [Defluviitaleaceae bacterium]|nr:redox-sensing transcriptional repressor Rex [Defluviitaleaceae bacterium]